MAFSCKRCTSPVLRERPDPGRVPRHRSGDALACQLQRLVSQRGAVAGGRASLGGNEALEPMTLVKLILVDGETIRMLGKAGFCLEALDGSFSLRSG